jgi:hypothetical protein
MSVTAPERALLAVTAALLNQERRIDRLSCALTVTGVLAVFAMAVATMAMFVPSVGCGLGELFFAVRVGFDAALFRRLVNEPEPADLSALDNALDSLGLSAPNKAGRPIQQRAIAACRLLRKQAASSALQALLLLAAAVVTALP